MGIVTNIPDVVGERGTGVEVRQKGRRMDFLTTDGIGRGRRKARV